MSAPAELTPAQARQARILAKSAERLAKITGAAKGEGRVVGDASVGFKVATPVPTAAPSARAAALAAIATDEDPEEVDLSALAFNPAATPNAMPNPFAAMMGGAGFPGAGGADGGDFMAQMMASMSAGGPPGAGGLPSTPVSPFPPVQKTMLDRVFPLIHFVSMVLLALYAVLVAEPAKRVSMLGMGEGVQWHVWGSLIHSAPATGVKGLMGFGGLSQVPLFYLFITVELLLQTTRALLLRDRPPPPSLLSTLLPFLSQFSPALALALKTGFSYIALLGICLNDLAVLVFVVGMVVVLSNWSTGGGGVLAKVQEVVEESWKAVGEL